ncbi:MAG: HNH endonuclease, partial [candidate division NC10 bacterium]|nr:HNH endonuclease [candidate division NC10 bacterium]
PDGLSSAGEVQIDSPWRLGKTTWSEVGGGVQMCAPAAAGDGVQTCASSWSQVRFWAPDDVAALWQHALNVCRLLEGRPLADWECVGRMIASFLHTWDVSGDPKWRRDHRIFERDGWRCRVPGCSSRRSLQVHHVIYRSRGGGDEDDNLAVLCALCRYRHKAHYADHRIMPTSPVRCWPVAGNVIQHAA